MLIKTIRKIIQIVKIAKSLNKLDTFQWILKYNVTYNYGQAKNVHYKIIK